MGTKESFQAFFLRSTEFRRSEFIEIRTKVHRLDKGYTHIPKRRRVWEIQDFELGRLPTRATALQEVRILPTLVLFPLYGLILGGMLCRCPKGIFS